MGQWQQRIAAPLAAGGDAVQHAVAAGRCGALSGGGGGRLTSRCGRRWLWCSWRACQAEDRHLAAAAGDAGGGQLVAHGAAALAHWRRGWCGRTRVNNAAAGFTLWPFDCFAWGTTPCHPSRFMTLLSEHRHVTRGASRCRNARRHDPRMSGPRQHPTRQPARHHAPGSPATTRCAVSLTRRRCQPAAGPSAHHASSVTAVLSMPIFQVMLGSLPSTPRRKLQHQARQVPADGVAAATWHAEPLVCIMSTDTLHAAASGDACMPPRPARTT